MTLKFDNKKIISRQNFRDILNQSNFRIDETLKLPIKWTYSGFILRGGWMFGKKIKKHLDIMVGEDV